MGRRFRISMVITDLAVLLGAGVIGSLTMLGSAFPWESTELFRGPAGPMVISLLGGAVVSEFVATKVLTMTVPRPSYSRASLVAIGTYVIVAVYVSVTRPWYSLGFLAVTAGVWLGAMLLLRFGLRLRPWSESMVVITANRTVVSEIDSSPHASIRELLDPQSDHVPDPLGEATGLVIDFGVSFSDKVGQFISSSLLTGTSVRGLTSVYEEHTGKLPLAHLADGWEIPQLVRRNRSYGPFKRILDLVLVLLATPPSIVAGIFAAIAVKVGSSGPIVYKQSRVGRRGKRFTLYKLRTMYVDSDSTGPRFASLEDPRITPVGRALRKLRLDELPQLWNVFKGDLSFVGPRPEQEMFVDMFAGEIPFYTDRHLVRPGITGWAQVNFGYAETVGETREKLKYDLFYIKHMSVWMDLRILLRTVATVITGSGSR